MRRIAVLLLFASVYAFAYCLDFSVNSIECLTKETDSWPNYSNGEPYREGSSVCIGSRKDVEKFEHLKQGIPVELNAYRKACRKVESIKLRFHGNRDCCSRTYTIGTESFKYCLEASEGPCSTKSYYLTTFSAELDEDVGFYRETMSWHLKDDPNFVKMGDSIDVFRDDGTLKYRGFISITLSAYDYDGLEVTEPVKTSGFCYDRKGKPTKRVNNVSACK